MEPALEIVEVSDAGDPRWGAAMAIYEASFPAWEREPESILVERLGTRRYRMWVGLRHAGVAGFYLLDLNPSLRYALFSFLAVDAEARGQGLGTVLCRDAMERFATGGELRWLLIEAEDRQAAFYGRLGFSKLDLPYDVPRFDGGGTFPMHLMVVSAGQRPTHIAGGTLRPILRHLFTSGYSLKPDDPRIAAQLARVGDTVELIPWPPGGDQEQLPC